MVSSGPCAGWINRPTAIGFNPACGATSAASDESTCGIPRELLVEAYAKCPAWTTAVPTTAPRNSLRRIIPPLQIEQERLQERRRPAKRIILAPLRTLNRVSECTVSTVRPDRPNPPPEDFPG